ncbi:MAG: PEGA domain-containing protein, partial [Thermoplasmata archaeon]|nr:PEGA domain-containing protein [Thermoplasmata archaeon]NIW91209.1 PEGA domain-containing protein [Thermoplasmata archaeon]NIY06615.1 PEGA domain-containing protein [Thermoplasmata archaeon]
MFSAALAVAQDGTGSLMGEVTIIGEDEITDGEVVVSLAGTNQSVATTSFSSSQPTFQVDLEPGDYTVYAWAKVHHNSDRVPFTVVANGTTWVNLTVVRIEEIIGTVSDPDEDPVTGAVLQFYQGGTIVGTSTSDDQGRFRDLLDPGTYSLKVTKAGYHPLERNVTITPGQVMELDLVVEPVPQEEEEEEFPWYTMLTLLFVLAAAWLSIAYMMRQARKLRRAAAEAEAARSRDMVCPECGGRVVEGSTRCPECSYVFQVRCDECGRSMDAGTEECPECGNPM